MSLLMMRGAILAQGGDAAPPVDIGTISAEDLTLFRYVETAEEAAAIIDAFEPAC